MGLGFRVWVSGLGFGFKIWVEGLGFEAARFAKKFDLTSSIKENININY